MAASDDIFLDDDTLTCQESQPAPPTLVRQLSLRKVCSSCSKPCLPHFDSCRGCGNVLSESDIQPQIVNPFQHLLDGDDYNFNVEKGEKIKTVLLRAPRFLVIRAFFRLSENKVVVIPTSYIRDPTDLDRSHIPLLQEMYRAGVEVLCKSSFHPVMTKENVDKFEDLEKFISCVFSIPSSVHYLHLHFYMPPFCDKDLSAPTGMTRGYPFKKVLSDLQTHGRIVLYNPADPSFLSEMSEALNHKKANHIEFCRVIGISSDLQRV
jgi:hypothetical protein